jgi:hypothetical protein
MERMPGAVPPASIQADAPGASSADAARRALKAQLLATEHWGLLATRSLSWNESFARATMFLTLLSGAIVALALVAQATSFGEGFVLFALLILPVVLFVGLATFVRLVEVNNEDFVWVAGMNRLRRAYLELDPDLGRHFVTGITEDRAGIMRSYGAHGAPEGGNLMHGFVTTPSTVAVVNAMVAAVLGAILIVQLRMAMAPAAALGAVIFLIVFGVEFYYGFRSASMAQLVVGADVSMPPGEPGGEALPED